MHYTLNDPRHYLAATKTIEAARERDVKLTVKIADTDMYTALQAIVNIAADAHMEISITSHRQPRTFRKTLTFISFVSILPQNTVAQPQRQKKSISKDTPPRKSSPKSSPTGTASV